MSARFRAAQPAAFDQIVDQQQPRISRLVHRLLGGADGVDDVVQEVFLAALQGLRRFRGECRLSTWLTTIAVNKCRSYNRRQRLRRYLLAWLAATAEIQRGDKGPDVDDGDLHARVRNAVGRLPPKYREAIVLRYFEELPVAEVAAVLGISAGAVEVQLSRARGRLREMLSIPSTEEI